MEKAEPICISVRVLVVDHFQPWREHICSILGTRPQFCVVAEVGDGLEAVQKAQELKPDLILVDIGLTSLDGLEAAARIHLERLPAYAPEFNPQEGVWNLLKRRELKNVCCKNLDELEHVLLLARARLRHRKHTLRHCFVHAGYSL